MNNIFVLAFRNISRQKKLKIIIAISVAVGFFIVTVFECLTNGMIFNLEQNVTQLIGGNVILRGYEKQNNQKILNIIRNKDYIISSIQKINIDKSLCNYFSFTQGQIIFEGNKSPVQLYGCEFNTEFLKNIQYIKKSENDLYKEESLIISDKLADSMNLTIDDTVMITAQTINGQQNVKDFIIRGVVRSNNFISGLMIFANISEVNNLLEMPEDAFSIFTINLKDSKKLSKIAISLEDVIREGGNNITSRKDAIHMNPNNIGLALDKQIRSRKEKWEGTKFSIKTLYDEVPAIYILRNFVHNISMLFLFIILIIIMIGLSNTYKITLYNRYREIATMRALGMSRKKTELLFITEAVFVCLLGACSGCFLAFILLIILKFIPVSNEALSIFLFKGHFIFKFSFTTLLSQYFLLIAMTVISVFATAKKAANMIPAKALRSIK